jgi:hypothetical protein
MARKKVAWEPWMSDRKTAKLQRQGRLLTGDDFTVNGELKSEAKPAKERPLMGYRVWAQKEPAKKAGVTWTGKKGHEGPELTEAAAEADLARWEAAGYKVVRNRTTVDVNDPKTGKRIANYDQIFDHRS